MQPVTQPPIEPCPKDNDHSDDGNPYVYKAKSPSYACIRTRFLLSLRIKFHDISLPFLLACQTKLPFATLRILCHTYLTPIFIVLTRFFFLKRQMSLIALSLF